MNFLPKSMRLVAVLLSCLMACESLATAQTRSGLRIMVVEGDGAINDIERGSSRDPVVEVRDEDDKPVAGARLTFSLPERGPGGSFFGAGNNLNVTTDAQGRATGAGFRPNVTVGRFLIHVTAVHGDRTATVNITQSNVRQSDGGGAIQPARKFGRSKLLAVIAGGAIIGAVVAARGGNETPSTQIPGTSITPGTVSVGTPR
jgi:hypothetical protein